jgi:uncharacterized LabA/DUF88 family protein
MRIRESLVDVDQLAHDSSDELGGTAVFFDFENIILGIHESFKVKKIIDHLTERGEVMVRRSYADWGRYRQYQRQFLEEGVQMVFLPSYGTSDKNRTDTAICVDAMEILFRREHIDTFVICSGDSDFGVLAQRLRSYGKRVVGISARSAASQILVKQCHEFIFYESLVGQTMQGYSRDEGEERMKRALTQLMDEYGRRFRASLLKDRMRKHDSTFSEKNYGASNFTRFLKNYSRVVRVLEGGKVEVLWSPEGEVGDSGAASVRPTQERPPQARPPQARPPQDRPAQDRPAQDRPTQDRPTQDRPPRGANMRTNNTRPSAEAQPSPAVFDRPPRGAESSAPADNRSRGARPPRPPEPSKMTPEVERQTGDLLNRAFTQALGDAGSIRMGRVKESLVTLSPGFDEGQLGFRSFASFLKAFPKVVSLDRYRDNVRPVVADPTPADATAQVVSPQPAPAAPPADRPAPRRQPAPSRASTQAAPSPASPAKKEAAAKKPAAKKPAAKKPAAKKPAAKKPAAKKPAAKKPAAKKPAAKKPAAKKPAAKKAAAKKPAAKKAAAKKPAAKKPAAKKPAAKKPAAKKTGK